ncbi:hypothetical protein B0J13DRAFT_520243 [Dactylonectria estremocensis]|uniref:DUF8035 domain-containing protein n=1 Tax=Dactylonectria estremocensis TaxID=1079267 RepID=A0A9P9FBJ2_9HYPO|nr:hypothetical protein B0J13DRAFT_520243 [Dactylonectria estremocensis]
MTDRYGYTTTGRSATFNPARSSLPASIGYTSLYAGDMHVMPSSTRPPPPSAMTAAASRGYVTTTTSSAVPATTTRTYAVTQDPRSQRPTTRDVTRSHRSSTLDSATGRPPVIVMTTQKDRPNPGPSYSSNARSGSPIRDDYRASEGQFYTEPASSIRSRSTRPYPDQPGSDDYARGRDHSDSMAREADAYRSSRPSVVYPSNPRHSSATIDYGDEGYQYTNAGELVRYDLDHPQASRSRRHESFDRGYYRPNINYNADQRLLNVNTSPDLGRTSHATTTATPTTRQYEPRGGPPPSTRGFDKISRARDSSRDVPPLAPAPPEPIVTTRTLSSTGSSGERRPRPVSLYQEGTPRSQHYDEYYRSRDDEKNMREHRDYQHESERAYEPEPTYQALTYEPQSYEPQSYDTQPTYATQPGYDIQPAYNVQSTYNVQPGYETQQYFHDDRVPTRGFGIRTDLVDNYEHRRDSQYAEETKKRSDDEPPRESKPDREEQRRSRAETKDKDPRRERRESKKGGEDDEKERTRFRDKMASGLGIAAAAVGLAPSVKSEDKRPKDNDSKARRGSDDDRERRRDTEDRDQPKASTQDQPKPRDYDKDRPSGKDSSEPRKSSRREADSRKNGEAVISASDSDEAKKPARRHRSSIAFNPNDASDLKQLKEQLAAMKTADKEKDNPVVIETKRNRSFSPAKQSKTPIDSKPPRDSRSPPETKPTREPRSPPELKPAKESTSSTDSKITSESKTSSPPRDESRGRELTVSGLDDKQVRLVSPPRDKKDDKPLKGILKQPKVSFPEELNPVREGVAPHKEDKKLREAPAGAKWTKVSRKIVNPEALTIGKERFEVRDDFVIVLRVLSKEEIQAYASATVVLRERRRREEEGDRDRDRDGDRERDRDGDRDRDRDRDRDDDDEKRRHRRRRHRDEDEADHDTKERDKGRDRDKDRERHRRHRDEDDTRSKDQDHHHHHHHY